MGLDTSIYLCLKEKNKDYNNPICRVGIAYWRKYYGLTNTLYYIARQEENWLNPDFESSCDYETTCRPRVLTDWIEEITKLLRDPLADEWGNSIWGYVDSRSYTARQLDGILRAETIVSRIISEYSLELYSEMFDDETKTWLLKRENPFTDALIDEITSNPDAYEWYVEFENSY